MIKASRRLITRGDSPRLEGLGMPDTTNGERGEKRKQTIAEIRLEQARREKTYRERALKLFPWVCAHCGREFSGRNLRLLTVHHKDHNHDNNPRD